MDRWCAERRLSKGAVVELDRCRELARLWYDGRARRDWAPRSRAEMQAIFETCGLVGEFWTLA